MGGEVVLSGLGSEESDYGFFIGQCRSFNLLDKVSWGSYLGFLSFYVICLRKVLGFMECRFLNLGKRKEDWNKSSLPSSFPIVS